ncbi:MAG: DUF4468 domain-containing protein [Calditrichae bacterium]|nr:DUF4468 domain-containing protein [Calditrichota bacterium]MCB9057765.1 DUF4468 domain-containing protein [Calditrichia bacterium]
MYWLLFKYQRNYDLPFSREEIYNRCLNWLNTPSAKLSKQDIYNDLVKKLLSAVLKVKIDSSEIVLYSEFKLTIECLDQKYRVIVEDFTFSYYDTDVLRTIRFKMESEDEWNLIKPYILKILEHLLKFATGELESG